jgi:hypothetical protein
MKQVPVHQDDRWMKLKEAFRVQIHAADFSYAFGIF